MKSEYSEKSHRKRSEYSQLRLLIVLHAGSGWKRKHHLLAPIALERRKIHPAFFRFVRPNEICNDSSKHYDGFNWNCNHIFLRATFSSATITEKKTHFAWTTSVNKFPTANFRPKLRIRTLRRSRDLISKNHRLISTARANKFRMASS